jgi:hypothetical protein
MADATKKMMFFAGATNIVSNELLVSEWIEKLCNKYGAWLTYESWLIFMNGLALGLVGDEPINDYNNLSLTKIGGWLPNHKIWFIDETVKAREKYESEQQEAQHIEDELKRRAMIEYKAKYEEDANDPSIPDYIRKQITEDERIMSELKEEWAKKEAALPNENSVSEWYKGFKDAKYQQFKKEHFVQQQLTENKLSETNT